MRRKDTTTDRKSGCVLRELEELLLSKFYDGECSFFERWQVRSLLKKKRAAGEFLEVLGEGSRQYGELLSSRVEERVPEEGRWEEVVRRIEEEERASQFLGNRVLDADGRGEESVFWRFFHLPTLLSREFMGAFACSAIVIVGAQASLPYLFRGDQSIDAQQFVDTQAGEVRRVQQQVPQRQVAEVRRTPELQPSSIVPVDLVSSVPISGRVGAPLTSENFDSNSFDALFSPAPNPSFSSLRRAPASVYRGSRPQRITAQREVQAPVEVDWIRSDGRVRMLGNSLTGAPTLFVKKRVLMRREASQVGKVSSPGSSSARSNPSGIVLQERTLPAAAFAK
ncbi:hypothetical protein MRY87_08875 [bacterium]|nr:hypothetical protein [bacterium]